MFMGRMHDIVKTATKIPSSYFFGWQQTASRVYLERQKVQTSQHNAEEQRGLTLHYFKTYYEAIVIKTGQNWQQKRQLDQ
jgi:hypothetical protein